MRLADWCKQQGHGEKTRLSNTTGVGFNIILYLVARRRAATYRIAKKISDATGGAVTIDELCKPVVLRSKRKAGKRRARKAVKARTRSKPRKRTRTRALAAAA
jgi:hypothetical protein